MTVLTPVTLEDLTQATVSGTGVFDVLMRATKSHLEEEFAKNRIRGPEYSQVYLGSLTAVMDTALQFLLQKDKNALEAERIRAEIELLQLQAANTILEGENLVLQGALLAAQKQNLDVEREFTIAKTEQTRQQTVNLVVEKDNLLLQQPILVQEAANLVKQGQHLDAQTAHTVQQKLNLVTQELQVKQQTLLTKQQTANAVTENVTMIKQQCKLSAEFDLIMEQKLKTVAEATLLTQKNQTEKAQTVGQGVDDNSVIGKQKLLYQAQTDGFRRDAEQKAAKLLVDSWNVRRTTDDGTVADGTNMLNDATIGRTITKLLTGIGA